MQNNHTLPSIETTNLAITDVNQLQQQNPQLAEATTFPQNNEITYHPITSTLVQDPDSYTISGRQSPITSTELIRFPLAINQQLSPSCEIMNQSQTGQMLVPQSLETYNQIENLTPKRHLSPESNSVFIIKRRLTAPNEHIQVVERLPSNFPTQLNATAYAISPPQESAEFYKQQLAQTTFNGEQTIRAMNEQMKIEQDLNIRTNKLVDRLTKEKNQAQSMVQIQKKQKEEISRLLKKQSNLNDECWKTFVTVKTENQKLHEILKNKDNAFEDSQEKAIEAVLVCTQEIAHQVQENQDLREKMNEVSAQLAVKADQSEPMDTQTEENITTADKQNQTQDASLSAWLQNKVLSDELNDVKERLEKANEQYRIDIIQAKGASELSQGIIDQYQNEIFQLKEKLHEMEALNQQVKTPSKEKLERMAQNVQRLTEGIDNKSAQLVGKNEEIANLQAQIDEIKNEKSALILEKDEKIEYLSKQVESLNGQLATMEIINSEDDPEKRPPPGPPKKQREIKKKNKPKKKTERVDITIAEATETEPALIDLEPELTDQDLEQNSGDESETVAEEEEVVSPNEPALISHQVIKQLRRNWEKCRKDKAIITLYGQHSMLEDNSPSLHNGINEILKNNCKCGKNDIHDLDQRIKNCDCKIPHYQLTRISTPKGHYNIQNLHIFKEGDNNKMFYDTLRSISQFLSQEEQIEKGLKHINITNSDWEHRLSEEMEFVQELKKDNNNNKPIKLYIKGFPEDRRIPTEQLKLLIPSYQKYTTLSNSGTIVIELENNQTNQHLEERLSKTILDGFECSIEPERNYGLVIQCQRCSQFGHTKRGCKRDVACKYCAQNHDSALHPKSVTRHTCPNCGERDHSGKSFACKVFRKAYYAALAKKYGNKQLARQKQARLDVLSKSPIAPPPEDNPWHSVCNLCNIEHSRNTSCPSNACEECGNTQHNTMQCPGYNGRRHQQNQNTSSGSRRQRLYDNEYNQRYYNEGYTSETVRNNAKENYRNILQRQGVNYGRKNK